MNRLALRALLPAAALPLLAGCGATLHGSAAGAPTQSPATLPTANDLMSPHPAAHGYIGPLPTWDARCGAPGPVDIAPGRPPDDKLPDYGFGPGPVYLSGQIEDDHAIWYASGEQALILVRPSYTGAVTVTGHAVGGSGGVVFDGGSSAVVPTAPPRSWWRYWSGRLSFAGAGCYELDVSGSGLHERIVVQAIQGTPLPG